MACHDARVGEEFPCAGWLHHQLGPGNNIAARIQVMRGQLPVPSVSGEQHHTFEATLGHAQEHARGSHATRQGDTPVCTCGLNRALAALHQREAQIQQVIERWRHEAARHKKHGDSYRVGQGWGMEQCAEELVAALTPAPTGEQP